MTEMGQFPRFSAASEPFVAQRLTGRRYSLDGKANRAKGRHAIFVNHWIAEPIMGLFKADFYRFFALGFAGGALLVFGAMGIGNHALTESLVPPAQAASLQH